MSDQTQKLKEVIALTAAYYGFNLNPQVLLMYVDDLAEFDYQDVINAYQNYRKNPKNRTMPLPAQIIGILTPEISQESQANIITGRIREAIGKFGWANPGEAKAHIGEIGWRVIGRFGGWSSVCENHGLSINPGQFNAQAREQVKAILEEEKLGLGFLHKALPYEQNKREQIDKSDDMILNDKKRDQALALLNHLKNNEMPK